MFLVDDLLLLPARGMMGIFRKIAEAAEEEYTDEGKVKEELMRVHMLYEVDQISEADHDKQERKLMQRLEDIRKYKTSAGSL